MIRIRTVDELKKVLDNDGPFYLFKHSTRCPISARALTEVSEYEKKESIPVYIVNVIEQRDVSNKVEEITKLRHESPQIMLFNKKRVVFDDSHFNITKDNLIKQEKSL